MESKMTFDCVKDVYNFDPMLRKHLHTHERSLYGLDHC